MNKILKRLFELQDIEYKEFTSKLIPNVDKDKIIGIRIPVLRDFAKEIFKSGDYEDFLKELPHHRLSDLATFYNVSYDGAHRALTDCKITQECFEKLQESILKEYSSLEDFIKNSVSKSKGTINVSEIVSSKDSFDESHPLFGKYCCFTGVLEKMVRKDAMQIVVDCGGFVENNVTANTNYLILGNNDYCSTIKDGKSTKHKKAEQLKLKGNDIEIIPETVFYDMIAE